MVDQQLCQEEGDKYLFPQEELKKRILKLGERSIRWFTGFTGFEVGGKTTRIILERGLG